MLRSQLFCSFCPMADRFRIGIVCGKLGDVDGVSLEVDKWIDVLARQGHELFTIAGTYAHPVQNVPLEKQLRLEKIRFDSPEQRHYESLAFPYLTRRPPHLTNQRVTSLLDEMQAEGQEVAIGLMEFVQQHDIDVLIGENTNAMPMTILGGIATYRVATEHRVATIFHHHDFWWERSRFSNNHIEPLLNRIMPPVDLALEHVVISTYAAHVLRSLKRVTPHVVPNCENFDAAVTLDDYNGSFRSDLGYRDDDILIVQPTRIVPRKRIEDSVELVGRFIRKNQDLAPRVRYIISLYQGDEPNQNYIEDIHRRAEQLGVPLDLISDRVASVRKSDESGRKLYTNRDVLANADLVTYLPIWEGFGNALLEAIAARVPVVTTTYLVYKTDIMTTGLRNIEIRDRYDAEGVLEIDDGTLDAMRYMITHPEERRGIVDENFRIARGEFGIQRLEERLEHILTEYGDEIRASRKRISKSKARYSV